MKYKILFSNIGYARGINGSLGQHLLYSYRHFYCSHFVQQKSLNELADIISAQAPDICCFIEIDKGSFGSGNFNQLDYLKNSNYNFVDIENKYGMQSWLRNFHHTRGKSSALLARRTYAYEYMHFMHGVKTLIYKVCLEENLTLFFAHFSLRQKVRQLQLQQMRSIIDSTKGEVILLGDFNILIGLEEIDSLLEKNDLVLLNSRDLPTFTFHKKRLLLDLCICSKNIASKAELKIIPQAFSDHAALLLEIN